MKLDPKSEALIRRYLLAAVSEDEREQIETHIMIKDDFLRQINFVEDELIDEYLDGDLSSADRRQFEEIFLCAPERQHKLRFAKALRVYATKAALAKSPGTERVKIPWWRPVLAWFNLPRPVLAYSLAASLLTFAVSGPWMLTRIAGLKGQISMLQAQQQNQDALENRWRTLFEEQKAKTDQIARLLQEQQEGRSATQLAEARAPRLPMANILSLTLTPGIMRDQQAPRRLEIPRGASLVALKLDLPENRYKVYKAVLLNEGQEILSRSRMEAMETADQITVRIELPVTDLLAGDYEIRLFGPNQQETWQSYFLRVARK